MLTEFRTRLLRGGAEERLLDRLLDRLQEAGFVTARGKQRTDSTHVLANIREFSRLGLVGETLRAALNEISRHDPERVRSVVSPIWHEFFDHRVEESRLPKSKKPRAVKACQMGLQGFLLLDWMETGRPALLELAELGKLPDLREQRGRVTEHRIESPYDPDARYRTRRSTRWTGYVVHLLETCDKDLPRIITHAHTTTANVHEAECTQDIHEALTEKRLQPGDHLADSALTLGILAMPRRKGPGS